MLCIPLPLTVKLKKACFLLNRIDNQYVLLETDGSAVCKFKYKCPSNFPKHLSNYFNENILPPDNTTYFQCRLSGEEYNPLFFYIFMQYCETYRGYLYPLIFNIIDETYYLCAQPIYYNHDQTPWLITDSCDPSLQIRSKFDCDEANVIAQIDLVKTFGVQVSPILYRLYKSIKRLRKEDKNKNLH